MAISRSGLFTTRERAKTTMLEVINLAATNYTLQKGFSWLDCLLAATFDKRKDSSDGRKKGASRA